MMSKPLITIAALAAALTFGCEGPSGPRPIADNSGKIVNTAPGDQLKVEDLYGKWDVDGERTNTINGWGDVTAIPADVVTDVLGKGWTFEPHGVLKVDRVIGKSRGTWKLEGKDTLAITEPHSVEVKYTAQFKDGYLYLLDNARKRYTVFERDKFFGF